MRFYGEKAFDAIPLIDIRNHCASLIESASILDMWEGYSLLRKFKKYAKKADSDNLRFYWVVSTRKWYFWGLFNYEREVLYLSDTGNWEDSYKVARQFNGKPTQFKRLDEGEQW